MKIGVVSDTHIPSRALNLPEKLIEAFIDVDYILHAGDITEQRVLEILSRLAPVEAVAGNMDPPIIEKKLGKTKILSLGGASIGLVHGDGWGGSTIDRAVKAFRGHRVDCIVFGHSHIPYMDEYNGILLFNPGSPTDKRSQKEFSFGILEITNGISGRIVFFDR